MASKLDAKPAAEQPEAAQPAAAQPEPEQGISDAPAADQPNADAADAPKAEANVVEQAPQEQSVENACAELSIEPDGEGNVELELLTSLAGANVKARGESHVCDAAEAVRMVRAGFAKPRA